MRKNRRIEAFQRQRSVVIRDEGSNPRGEAKVIVEPAFDLDDQRNAAGNRRQQIGQKRDPALAVAIADLYDLKIDPSKRGPYAQKVYGFSHLSVTSKRMTLRHLDSSGQIIHAFTKTPEGNVAIVS